MLALDLCRTTTYGQENTMRRWDEKAMIVLGFAALTAMGALLFRMSLRANRRNELRDEAVEKLKESGEHIFAAV